MKNSDNPEEKCPDCSGKGSHYIVTRWEQSQDYGPEPAEGYSRPCKTCGGSGKKPVATEAVIAK